MAKSKRNALGEDEDTALMARLDEWKARKLAALPSWAYDLNEIMNRMPHGCGGGIGGVTLPSHQAEVTGMGSNYLAVSGDGMFMFAFEVLDPDRFRFQRPWITPIREGEWSQVFRNQTGHKFDDVLSYQQLADGLRLLVAYYQGEWDRLMGPLLKHCSVETLYQ